MTHLNVSRDLQPLPQSRTSRPASTAWGRFVQSTNSSDLPIIIAICLAGLLLMLNFLVRYPDVGAVIQQYNMF
jgi:hypothetical protein